MEEKIVLKYRPDLWIKYCSCDEIIKYGNYDSFMANRKKIPNCKKCQYEKHSTKLTGKKRPPFSKKWRINLAKAHKNSEVWKQSMNTSEYKEKHRQKMFQLIKNNKISVAYNPNACDVFNFINQQLNWNGLHATNGKERVVENFYLDYYEPNLNIAIEWDEKHHRKPKHRQLDGFKQKLITDKIRCEFYRIDDVTKQIKKVDHNSIDRSIQLQAILNEYYENKK